MHFIVAMRDNIVAWSVYYYGGRSHDRRILHGGSPSEILNAGVVASVLGTSCSPPDWSRYDLFYIVSVEQDVLIKLTDKGRLLLKEGVGFHTVIRELGSKILPKIEAMGQTPKEMFRMAEMLDFAIDED